MMRFRFTESAIDAAGARRELLDHGAGGYVSFEGWVRDHNEGQEVTRLEYEAFQALAVKEGNRILMEAAQRFPIKHAACIHRLGSLDLSDIAVWVGVSSAHRGEAFDACRFIIDEVKHRVPIWKKEHYRNGDSGWVNCERCAAAPRHDQTRTQAHSHSHEHGHDQLREGMGASERRASGLRASDSRAFGPGASDLDASDLEASDLRASDPGTSEVRSSGLGASGPGASGLGASLDRQGQPRNPLVLPGSE